MKKVSRKQFTRGAIWKIIESFSSKGITMIVSIILARILSPQDYGIIALTGIFLNFSNIIIDGGFSTALIRKKEVDDCDYSSAFIASFSIAMVIYFSLFIGAPYFADYYQESMLCSVLRVLGLTVFIQAITVTRTVVVSRNMQFQLLCYCNIISSIFSGFIGIIAALMGAGVWAIVIQWMLQNLLMTILFFKKIKFNIKWKFNLARLKDIMRFSIGVMSASFLYFVTNNMYSSVIGKKYSVTDLGYYSKGNQLPEQICLYTFSAVSGVLLPTISSCQDDLNRMKYIIRKVTAFSTYIIFPLMAGMMMMTEELIVLIFGEKWMSAAPVMIGSCIYYIGMPFTLMNSQVYYALGRNYVKLKIECIRFVLMVIGLTIGILFINARIEHLAIICGFIMIISAVMSFYETGKMLQYRFFEIVQDVGKPFFCTVLMSIVIWFSGHAFMPNSLIDIMIMLVLKTSVGIVIYIIVSEIFKPDGYYEIRNNISSVICKIRS